MSECVIPSRFNIRLWIKKSATDLFVLQFYTIYIVMIIVNLRDPIEWIYLHYILLYVYFEISFGSPMVIAIFRNM